MLAQLDRLAADGTLRPDAGQRAVLAALDQLRQRIERPRQRLSRGQPEGNGLYLWGDVGRGKTMLMDLFFTQTNVPEKRRMHFDAFMRDLHMAIHQCRKDGLADPLAGAVGQIIGGARLLALDEMQIRDAADSTLLRGAFNQMFAAGVAIVTTSNMPPAGLFAPGPNRQAFQPLIDLLTARMSVHHLSGPIDYRRQVSASGRNYICPNDAPARRELDQIWHGLVAERAGPKTLRILGRDFLIPLFHDGMARMSFEDACAAPRSPADYLALCADLRVLVLDDVPQLSAEKRDVARRFIMLVDALYDAKVRLIVSAETEPDLLYPAGDGALAFQRLISRLTEMQGWA